MAIKNKISQLIKKKYLSFFLIITLLFITLPFVGLEVAYAVTNPQLGSTGLQAEIPGNPPSVGANITFPSNGQSFTTLPVKVGGTCTGDVLVKIFKNGIFGGSVQCKNGVFSLTTDLYIGKNELTAKVYDALDQAGPDSNVVTVNFTPTGYNNSGPRVSLSSDFAKKGADPGDYISWPIILSGGTGPYAMSVDWGDGTTELISQAYAGQVGLSHRYTSPGVYTLIIKVTDANGDSAFLQLAAVGNGALSQDSQAASTAASNAAKKEILWWPTIAALVLVIISFWLGSRSGLVTLRKQAEQRINY